jgi:hypothetical protein
MHAMHAMHASQTLFLCLCRSPFSDLCFLCLSFFSAAWWVCSLSCTWLMSLPRTWPVLLTTDNTSTQRGVGQGVRAKTRNLINKAYSVESAVFGWSIAYYSSYWCRKVTIQVTSVGHIFFLYLSGGRKSRVHTSSVFTMKTLSVPGDHSSKGFDHCLPAK